jgi:hypothetical protein
MIDTGMLDRLEMVLRDYRQIRSDYDRMVKTVNGESLVCKNCKEEGLSIAFVEQQCVKCWYNETKKYKKIILDLHFESALYLGLPCYKQDELRDELWKDADDKIAEEESEQPAPDASGG